jgi:FKBP-type peptidyl-prolyl cis-trans isomerase
MRILTFALALITLPFFAAAQPLPSDLSSPPADAERHDGGLVTKVLEPGSGEAHPAAGDIARVRYSVRKSDGTLVQELPPGRSVVLGVSKMLPGWSAAVQMMTVGEQRRAWIPASLGGGKIAEGELFVIDTELLEILETPKTPADVAAPPADATTTASGLSYKVLRPGTGSEHPTRRNRVVVHYSGWTTDGKMFDSSILRGDPATFGLTDVIRGWTEGLQLMIAGEKTRFWIPAKLAYGNDRSKPQGMLVFDVELLEIR